MKRAGKTNKLLAGLAPHERYVYDLHGDRANPGISQFIGYAAHLVGMESGSEHEKKLARMCWDKDVLTVLERELRQGLAKSDGSVFISIGEHLARFRRPVDPLRAWIATAMFSARTRPKGPLGLEIIHEHTDKTSTDLFGMFRSECPEDKTGFNEFCRALRKLGAVWRKSKGGAPQKKKPRRRKTA